MNVCLVRVILYISNYFRNLYIANVKLVITNLVFNIVLIIYEIPGVPGAGAGAE